MGITGQAAGVAACLHHGGLLSRVVTDPVAPPVPRPAHPPWLLVVMILLSVGYALGFACSLVGLFISPFLFDSGDTPRNWHAFYLVVALPPIILLSAATSWCAYGFRKYLLIPLGLVLPVADVVVLCNVFS